jgi:hypothetical protein
MRSVCLIIAVVLAAPGVSATAEREWQDGTWATPTTVTSAGKTARTYAIETDQFRLDVQDTAGRSQPPLTAAIDTAVTFAIESDTVYVRQGAGERALHLITRSPKLNTYAAAGAGHYLRTVADGGLTMTLEDGSIWDLDPSQQDTTAHWQPLAGIIVTYEPDQAEDGFNYFLNNTDDDEGALAKLRAVR